MFGTWLPESPLIDEGKEILDAVAGQLAQRDVGPLVGQGVFGVPPRDTKILEASDQAGVVEPADDAQVQDRLAAFRGQLDRCFTGLAGLSAHSTASASPDSASRPAATGSLTSDFPGTAGVPVRFLAGLDQLRSR